MPTIQFLVEGQTEAKLLKGILTQGNVTILDLWERDAEAFSFTIKPKTELFIVFDTDTAENKTSLSRFISNFRKLQKACRHSKSQIFLLQQRFNIEDELAFSCHVSQKDVFKRFSAESKKEFVSRFIAEPDEAFVQKLKELGLDFGKLWSRPIIYELQEFEAFSISGRRLNKLVLPIF